MATTSTLAGSSSVDTAPDLLRQVVESWAQQLAGMPDPLPGTPQKPHGVERRRRPAKPPATLRPALRRLLESVVLKPLALARLTLLDLRLLHAGWTARQTTRKLIARFNQAASDGDDGLALLHTIASHCATQLQRLNGCYEQRRRLEHAQLLPLHGAVMHQLEALIGEVEDLGETAALSASPEFTSAILKQLAAHGIAG